MSEADKQTYRQRAKDAVRALGEEERQNLSKIACAHAATLGAYRQAGTILAYQPIRGECSPMPLVALARREGKRVAFPLCVENRGLALYLARCEEDFLQGAYGIREPNPARCGHIMPDEIDFALIPGLAFDRACNRLGRGAGYYDRLLENFHGAKAGLAYSCQLFPCIPAGEWDVRMDFVVTNDGIIVKNPQ